MELTKLPSVGAVRKHLLEQAGYSTIEIVASRSVADIQRDINVNCDTARRIIEEAIMLTGAEECKNSTGVGMNDDECMDVALKELEWEGLIKDRNGDDWTATERGMIKHKKLMILLGIKT